MVTLDDVRAAQPIIAGRLHRTPLVGSTLLGRQIGAPVYLKLESWQKTGSFKPRGVLTRIARLTPEERSRGLITASAGNHAQAVAWAAKAAGLSATVVMPATALTVFTRAHALAAEQGLVFVSPFDDEAIVAGQGTVGLEILEDLPEVGTIVVPIGGGGLIAGIAVAAKALRPGIRIIGVEPTGAAAMWRSLREGHAVRLDRVDTIADGLGAPFAGEITYPLVREYVDDLVLVEDAAIRAAMALILERCKLLAEPAGAAAVAALLQGQVALAPDAPVVAILSGGNVDVGRLAHLLGA